MNSERYARQIILPEVGERGQKRLAASGALIVGLGGLGCPVGLYLAGAGVGRLGLADSDAVSLSNLQRQTLYSEAMVGMPKTLAARDRLAALNGEVEFETFSEGLTSENAEKLVGSYDVVVDCCDNFATRYLIGDTCRRLGKPWVHGSIGAFIGQVATFMPDAEVTYEALYPDRELLADLPASAGGVMGAVPGVVGAIEASEALRVLLGLRPALAGKMLAIDLATMSFNTITL